MSPIRRSNLSEDAYTFVRDLFISGDRYNPGDKISVEELSRELGVSRTPLWGAINRLEAEGIVEVVPRQGVYLIKYDLEHALEIYLAREALEGMVARLAAERITDQEVAELQASIDRQRRSIADGDLDGYHVSALEFHEKILRIAHNSTLERLLMSVLARIRAMRIQSKSMPTRLPQSCDDHSKILAALQLGDADLAESRARNHIRELADQIRRQLAPSPAPPAKSKSVPRLVGSH
jgi:DNA-binding GntR family transcriptional regulator